MTNWAHPDFLRLHQRFFSLPAGSDAPAELPARGETACRSALIGLTNAMSFAWKVPSLVPFAILADLAHLRVDFLDEPEKPVALLHVITDAPHARADFPPPRGMAVPRALAGQQAGNEIP